MCVAFLFIKARGDTSRAPAVVLCVNRDEAFGRPTLPSHWWEDAPDVFAGRDLEAMGTWCGVSRTGRVAVLTNYTEPTEEGADATGRSRPSRGALAADFLKGPTKAPPDVSAEAVSANAPFPWTPSAYAAKVAGERDAYAGFNLIVGDCVTGEFAYVGNRGDAAGDGSPVRLDVKKGDRCSYENVRAECAYGGACGVSNAALGAPWPKVVAGAARLTRGIRTRDGRMRGTRRCRRSRRRRCGACCRTTGRGVRREKTLARTTPTPPTIVATFSRRARRRSWRPATRRAVAARTARGAPRSWP